MALSNTHFFIVANDLASGDGIGDGGDFGGGSGYEVDATQYGDWANNNNLYADSTTAGLEVIVGADNKISVINPVSNNVYGYSDTVQPGSGTGSTTFSVANTLQSINATINTGISGVTGQQTSVSVSDIIKSPTAVSILNSFFPGASQVIAAVNTASTVVNTATDLNTQSATTVNAGDIITKAGTGFLNSLFPGASQVITAVNTVSATVATLDGITNQPVTTNSILDIIKSPAAGTLLNLVVPGSSLVIAAINSAPTVVNTATDLNTQSATTVNAGDIITKAGTGFLNSLFPGASQVITAVNTVSTVVNTATDLNTQSATTVNAGDIITKAGTGIFNSLFPGASQVIAAVNTASTVVNTTTDINTQSATTVNAGDIITKAGTGFLNSLFPGASQAVTTVTAASTQLANQVTTTVQDTIATTNIATTADTVVTLSSQPTPSSISVSQSAVTTNAVTTLVNTLAQPVAVTTSVPASSVLTSRSTQTILLDTADITSLFFSTLFTGPGAVTSTELPLSRTAPIGNLVTAANTVVTINQVTGNTIQAGGVAAFAEEEIGFPQDYGSSSDYYNTAAADLELVRIQEANLEVQGESPLAIDLQLLRIQEVNQEVQGDNTIRKILTDVKGTFGTEAELRTAAAAELADYFGINSPLGLSAIDKALKLVTAQVPGVSQVRTVTGLADKGISINDIVTNSNINLQDIYNTVKNIALIANPALRIPLFVAEGLVGLATDAAQTAVSTVTDSITTITGGGVGDEGELPGDLTVYNVPDSGTSQSFQATATAADATVAENLALTEARTLAFDRFGATTTGFTGVDEVNVRINDNGTYTATYSISAQSFQGPAAVSNNDATAAGIDSVIAEQNTDGIIPNTGPGAVQNIYQYPVGPNGQTPYDDNGNLNPGWALNENNDPVYVGNDYFDPTTLASAAASRQAATLASARSQAAQQSQRKQANDGDWRVKLRLAPSAEYLYKDPGLNSNGILWPLNVTDGVIFPYMPVINTSYHANYNSYDLTHSNYRGYFYQNSYVGEVNMTAVFTAQDTKEAEYMLAVIHFFRSATKMFYGQDAPGRGSPPPLVYLQGLGEYQFNLHPCLISQFTYNLPNDVDYIRARSPNLVGTNLQIKRDRKTNPTNPFSAAIERLNSIGQPKGGINIPPAPPTLGTNSPTYVPTKIEIQLTLLPTQTRQQVSQEFSLQKFANGNLLKGGFW